MGRGTVEVGAWEGRSTVALANMAYPDVVHAIDTWEGNVDEHPDHETVVKCRERDVAGRFLRNVAALTAGNVRVVRKHSAEALAGWPGPVKFAHIDGSHDCPSVRRDLSLLLPRVPAGGVICGDDYQSAEGVRRAVRELLPGFEHVGGNFWVWQRKE